MNQQQKIQQAMAMAAAYQNNGGAANGAGGNPYAAMMSMGGGSSASEVMASALQGNQMAWAQFSTNPSLYQNDPEAVHKHLGQLVNGAGGPQGATLISTVSRAHPEALVPHTAGLLKYCSDPMMGPILIQALKEVALVDPTNIFPYIPQILPFAKGQMGAFIISQMVGAASNARSPPDAAAQMFSQLISMLQNKPDPSGASGILNEISNMKERVPAQLLQQALPVIRTFKGSNGIIVTTLEDYILGRTNEHLSVRIDDLEEKIKNFNSGCAQSINLDQVIAYIDANIKDVKDFVGDVAKKLPTPKRLEVVGTLRKTFILHFECAHTGREYPIKSADWSKWLKIGFSLAKAGKMVFDVGTGNPLGLISTGIDCVKGIYEAYKTQDDDEFLSYIKNPFLLSTEQDMLLNKLRDQGFFEKFAYDNQIAGWYLLNPEVDGVLPEGEAGSVTSVRSKKGSTFDTIKTLAEEKLDMEIPVSNPMAPKPSPSSAPASSPAATSSSAQSPVSTPSSTGGPGPRAAAVRAQMVASGTVSAAGGGADQTLALAEQLVGINQKLEDMNKKIMRLEADNREIRALASSNQGNGCNCVIS